MGVRCGRSRANRRAAGRSHCHRCSQPVKTVDPEACVPRHPVVDLAKALGRQRVDPLLAADFDLHKTRFAQRFQMLRDSGRADVESRGNLSRAAAALGEQLHHAAAVGVGESKK